MGVAPENNAQRRSKQLMSVIPITVYILQASNPGFFFSYNDIKVYSDWQYTDISFSNVAGIRAFPTKYSTKDRYKWLSWKWTVKYRWKTLEAKPMRNTMRIATRQFAQHLQAGNTGERSITLSQAFGIVLVMNHLTLKDGSHALTVIHGSSLTLQTLADPNLVSDFYQVVQKRLHCALPQVCNELHPTVATPAWVSIHSP